ncbi:hypothetical protein QDR37_12980 [Amnibacterium sp. CER49]|uniref:hypothetical protein n=1 Tax=Amnibacterium sp. CER49 TaxID=3039161 RepID=UPI0024497014|nr:hypothetical protein [Amnibacterium sp. CER49]MDH2444863.1 hypothetical protein [Amnibacterium sp. CER49]
MSAPPRLAATLFSFTNELLAAEHPPDALLDGLLRAEPDVAVEIDAAQHLRSYPLLDLDEVRRTAAVVAAAGGSASLLGAGADVAPGPGPLASDDERLAQLRSQVAAASALGAEGLRIPFGVLGWDVLAAAAADAREAGVLILEEVQGPADPAGGAIASRIDDLERTGETAVRLLLDTSALMSGLPPSYVDAVRAEGVPGELLDRLADALAERRVAPVVLPALGDDSLTPAAHALLITALTRFGAAPASAWLPLAPWIAAVHVKWWDLESAARDLAGEAGAVIDGLLAAGLPGTVCSEWGGHEWQGLEVAARDQVAAHLTLLRNRFRATSPHFGTKPT